VSESLKRSSPDGARPPCGVRKVVPYSSVREMSDLQRREFHQALLDADSFEDLSGKWQAAILKAERNRPKLRLVSDA
jgi:hypothetical protein